MYIVCGMRGMANTGAFGRGIMDIVRAGYENAILDMTTFCSSGELELSEKGKNGPGGGKKAGVLERPEKWQGDVKKFLEQCKEKGLSIPIGMAPYLRRDTKRSDLNELLFQLAEESIKICGRNGCGSLIVRPLSAGIRTDDIAGCNREYYMRLAPIARENNVQILLENQCRDINGHLIRGICSDEREAVKWVDCLNEEAGEERFGFCLNAGTCSICGQNMYGFVRMMGKRLKAVVLRECKGNEEASMLPFTCVGAGGSQTDWLNLIRGLREMEFDGQLVMDFSDTISVFPLRLRPQLMGLSKSVADYFKWQIGMETVLKKYPARVLFGAGNMCRNYMKCYGEKYPPLFTCDNNRSVWGTEFCGLMVKAPEYLKELPEDCAIFICTIYYEEIEAQLRDMGIKNPIEFFNDENMPSFYFDRLDGEAGKHA